MYVPPFFRAIRCFQISVEIHKMHSQTDKGLPMRESSGGQHQKKQVRRGDKASLWGPSHRDLCDMRTEPLAKTRGWLGGSPIPPPPSVPTALSLLHLEGSSHQREKCDNPERATQREPLMPADGAHPGHLVGQHLALEGARGARCSQGCWCDGTKFRLGSCVWVYDSFQSACV